MKKLLIVTLVILACTAIVAAQQETGVYSVNYYSNRNNTAGADQFTRVINPGTQGTPITPGSHGAICADMYVFDANQEMVECCSCKITANGLLELSVLHDLTASPLTGFPAPSSGAVKIVSDLYTNCNPTAPQPVLELLAWATHVQQPVSGAFVTTEEEYRFAPLAADELQFLGQACSFVQYLGSGKGVCKCGSGPV
jgi:hypothetical protein